MAKSGYLYTLKTTGEVVEREVVIVRHRHSRLAVAKTPRGQNVIVSAHAMELHNDNMWSTAPKRNVYIERMIDVLLAREDVYREKMRSAQRRITRLKACAVEG